MLLAVDIGNTNITFGIFRKSRMVRKFDIPTGAYSQNRLKRQLPSAPLREALICSVVPSLTQTVNRGINRALGIKPHIIGRGISVPIKNCYRKPAQVGCDRLVNAYAASVFYGAPLIAVDFGTAITFDIICAKKEYLGGMILPGLGLCSDVLAERTALLPKVRLGFPREFIGRDTKSSITSGIVYGFAALTDELITRIRKKIRKNAPVVGTGGNIDLIRRYCRKIDIVDKDLTLKGINLLYLNANRKRVE